MIRSMTGYSSVREQVGEAIVSLEIKALNHKGYDVHFHSSRALSMLETPFRERLQKSLRRGRIEVYLRSNGSLFHKETILPNLDAAQQYYEAAHEIANHLGLDYTPKIEAFFQLDGIFELEESEQAPDEAWSMIEPLVERAIDGLQDMKKNEGERLQTELVSILERMSTLNEEIQNSRESIMEDYREKLLTRIHEWKQSAEMEFDENRIIQEVVFYTDRSDIQEETVRLRSHIEQFHELLKENQPGQNYKAIGRRLDFLCQEMVRETNTIGSKSSSMEIIHRVLELKSAVEQLREQVQNVE